jgi:membrane associated rhomboid family serine protease
VIPIATDQAARRTPTATIALIAANVLAYLAMLQAIRGNEEALEAFVLRWGLCREAFHWWQPVTYQFVHDAGSLWHLLGNMIFLWVFGSAVESRMRSWGFLALYLTGGMVAGLCQMAMSGVPLVGASGSVSAVTGAFIVLFPRARVARDGAAEVLGDDLGAALLRVLERLEHEHAGALAHHEAVAVDVPRAVLS